MLVGVGGLGILLTTRILSDVIISGGFDLKISEIHGMAQRGGSVHTMVRFGQKVYSPVICKGEADFVLSFELLEALRWADYLSPTGTLIASKQRINPLPVAMGWKRYPDVLGELKRLSSRVLTIDPLDLAKKAGNVRGANLVMLGAMGALLPFPAKTWDEAISGRVREETVEFNLSAFKLGWEQAKKPEVMGPFDEAQGRHGS
jgi:indolepyruvate ferredoxin oxidoreductase beta subunit